MDGKNENKKKGGLSTVAYFFKGHKIITRVLDVFIIKKPVSGLWLCAQFRSQLVVSTSFNLLKCN